MPILFAVGQHLLRGEFTPLTLQMQNGGALLAEYQYALLNPISLFSYVVGSLTGRLASAAAVIAVIHLTLLCLGVYALARSFKIFREMALVAAVAYTSNNFIFYWYASSWLPGLVSLTWFVWSAACLVKASENRAYWTLGAAFTYLTISSGWPHTVLMLGLFATVIAGFRWRQSGRLDGLAILTSFIFGGLIAAPSVFPLLAMSQVSARTAGLLNDSDMVVNLYNLLGLSSPFQFGHIKWGSLVEFGTPFLFCAWFVLPLLPFLNLQQLPKRQYSILILLMLAALTAIATQGPDTVGSIRTPVRFVPFLHLFLLLLFGLAASLQTEWRITRHRVVASFSLVAFSLISSIQIQPKVWLLALFGAIIVSLLVLLFMHIRANRPGNESTTLLFGTIVTLCLTRAVLPTNANLPEWKDKSAAIYRDNLADVPTRYSILIAPFGATMDKNPIKARFGAMALTHGEPTISGYSPVGLRNFADRMCVETHGFSCPAAAAKLLAPTALGPPLADLLRIDQIKVYDGDQFDRANAKEVQKDPLLARSPWGGWISVRQHWLPAKVQQELDANWALARDDEGIRTYVRRAPRKWASGSIAWSSAGLAAHSIDDARATREAVVVRGAGRTGGTIVFTRLAWPGYRAEFNGRPVPVTTSEGFLVTVDLPAGAGDGSLVLRYEPPLIRPALLVCAAGALAFLLGLAFWTRIFKRQQRQTSSIVDAPATS